MMLRQSTKLSQFFGIFPSSSEPDFDRGTDEDTPLLRVFPSVPRRYTRFNNLSFSIPRVRFARPRISKKHVSRHRSAQIFPTPKRYRGDRPASIFEIETWGEKLKLRVLILSPFPCDKDEPLLKSSVEVRGDKAKVRAELYRSSGAEDHYIRMIIRARTSPVILVLPPMFHGTINIYSTIPSVTNSTTDSKPTRSASCSRSVRRRVEAGDIRLGAEPREGEDEIIVYTRGSVTLLMGEDSRALRTEWYRPGSGWLFRSKVKPKSILRTHLP